MADTHSIFIHLCLNPRQRLNLCLCCVHFSFCEFLHVIFIDSTGFVNDKFMSRFQCAGMYGQKILIQNGNIGEKCMRWHRSIIITIIIIVNCIFWWKYVITLVESTKYWLFRDLNCKRPKRHELFPLLHTKGNDFHARNAVRFYFSAPEW